MTQEEAKYILEHAVLSWSVSGSDAREAIQIAIEALKRKKGEWIFEPKDAIELMFTKPKCSECGYESSDGWNFCSNCGAQMRGEANE